MRSTNKLICLFALCCGGSLAADARMGAAQSTEPRYGMPPSADFQAAAPPAGSPVPAPVVGEPLLSYRRDDAVDSAVPAVKEPRLASSATLDDSNPLRKPAEPPFQADAMAAAPLAEAPAVEATSPQTIPTPSGLEAAAPPMASTPFPMPESNNPLPPLAEVRETPIAESPLPTPQPLMRYDMAVQPAVHQAEAPAEENTTPGLETAPSAALASSLTSRRLAPQSSEINSGTSESEATAEKKGALPFAFSKLESFTTAGAGLAIVIGLFLICAWTLRRGGPKTGGMLPTDAFAVLGRAPLSSQSFAHLLRLGNKLVLVAMSSDGIQPLTEVTDPMEVDRLTGLCASGRGHGPAAEFKQVLAQLAKEPARGFLGAEASDSGRRR